MSTSSEDFLLAEITRRRSGELVRGVFQVLSQQAEGVSAKDVLGDWNNLFLQLTLKTARILTVLVFAAMRRLFAFKRYER